MQKLRRLNFFDRHVVKQDGSDVHPGIQKLSVWCACGTSEYLWLGDRGGSIRRLDRQHVLSEPVQAFDRELVELRGAQEGARLVALGFEAVASGSAKFKVFDAHCDGEPLLLVAQRVALARGPDVDPTRIAVSSALSTVAIGLSTGILHLWRGRDLSRERPYPIALGEEGPRVTAVHLLEQRDRARTVLFVCTEEVVRSWAMPNLDSPGEPQALHTDPTGGVTPHCSCLFPTLNTLLVARSDAVFAYDPDEGNMSAMHLEGEKVALSQFKSYFVSVISEAPSGGPGLAPGAPAHSAMPRQTVTVCLAYPHMRFIAYSSQFTDVVHVVSALGSIFVFSRGGADGSNTVLFELREKPLRDQLDVLVNKRMFEWAAEIALHGGAPQEVTADIYREHGDALFAKRAYDQALGVYMKTIDLGIPLEPSYVVEKFLDAQRIAHVAQYLKRLHEKNLAEREHTALLLKCYTKLKDLSTLDEFLEKTPVSQYDPATAVEVLETAGYYGLAAEIAQKPEVGRYQDYVRISLEHFESYAKTVAFIGKLPAADAVQALLEHGRVLLRHAPQETVDLVRELCGLRHEDENDPTSAMISTGAGASRLHELLPIFLGDLPQLELVLRSVLLSSGPCPVPPDEAGRLFPTLFELMVRSYRELEQDGDESVRRRLHGDIMWLLRQYQHEEALASALMLSQTYGFVDGIFFAAEKLGRFQLLMSWCFARGDAKRLVEVCKRCGSMDQSLWVQALSWLAADEGDHIEEISEVLAHVESSELMPLLMVLETLQQSPSVTIGAVRPYLQGQFRRLMDSVETSRGKAHQDRQEILRMQQELVSLRTEAQVFQNTKCSMCCLALEVPAVHFFCGHSYHAYCVHSDGGCPQCSSEALPKIALRQQREAQARSAEDFFRYLQGSSGEKQIQAVGDWCKFGPFDAGGDVERAQEEAP